MKNKIVGIFVCMLLITTGFSFDVLAEQNNPPNRPAKPIGETSGKVGVSYVYSSSTTDNDGDLIYYLFDWGDGTDSGWVGTYRSGDTCQESHIWTTKGYYSIKVKAKDLSGAESPWSEPLPITIGYIFSGNKTSIYIGLIKDKEHAVFGNYLVTCILVFHIEFYNGQIETEILQEDNRISILFNIKIGIVLNHIICAIFFTRTMS